MAKGYYGLMVNFSNVHRNFQGWVCDYIFFFTNIIIIINKTKMYH